MEGKTIVFGDSGNSNGMLSLLAPMLQQRGLDPNLLLAMNNRNGNNGGFGGEGGWFMWIIFLFFLMGWGGNGWGNNNGGGGYGAAGLPNLINNDAGRELLMSAIQGNGNAINALASNLNCSIGQVQTAINAVTTQIQNVGNQVGQSSLQIINAIQAGNNSIAAQLAQCCCDQRLAICQQTNTLTTAINGVATSQERGFANIGFETQRQTCDITKSIADSTEKILAGQRAAEMRDMQSKIDRLSEENSTYKTSAMTSQIVGQAIAPIAAGLNDVSARLGKIECKQPETVTIPYSPVVGVPQCVAAQYGIGPFGIPYGAGTGFFG